MLRRAPGGLEDVCLGYKDVHLVQQPNLGQHGHQVVVVLVLVFVRLLLLLLVRVCVLVLDSDCTVKPQSTTRTHECLIP